MIEHNYYHLYMYSMKFIEIQTFLDLLNRFMRNLMLMNMKLGRKYLVVIGINAYPVFSFFFSEPDLTKE